MSLILEYCAFGDLRKYLIDHRASFIKNILHEKTSQDEKAEKLGDIKHDDQLLLLWAYQVGLITLEAINTLFNIFYSKIAKKTIVYIFILF